MSGPLTQGEATAMRAWLDDYAATDGLELVLVTWDHLDRAIVGIARQYPSVTAVVYDYEAMVQILVDEQEMSDEDAREYVDFNVVQSYVGPGTPMTLYRPGAS